MYSYIMDTRQILWDNVKALMIHRYGKENAFRVVTESKGAVSKGTMDRLKKQDNFLRMDSLEALAKFFDLMPWQIMVPNLDPSNPPVFTITDAERKFYDKAKRLRDVAQQLIDQ